MSRRRHVFHGEYVKEFKCVRRSRKGEGCTHCVAGDSEINLEAMGSRSNETLQNNILRLESPIKLPDLSANLPGIGFGKFEIL